MASKKFIIMLGAPGSGKGTQGKLLANDLDFAYFSMGQVLREYSKGDSETAKEIRTIIDGGRIIPDTLIRQLIMAQAEKYKGYDCVIIDAFPRDMGQVPILNEVVKKYGIESVRVVYLDVPKEQLIARISERKSEATEKRADDDPKIIETRFREYMEKTLPLKDYFQKAGILLAVNGDAPIEDVHKEILSKLGYAK